MMLTNSAPSGPNARTSCPRPKRVSLRSPRTLDRLEHRVQITHDSREMSHLRARCMDMCVPLGSTSITLHGYHPREFHTSLRGSWIGEAAVPSEKVATPVVALNEALMGAPLACALTVPEAPEKP
jgi:hypothetical protein